MAPHDSAPDSSLLPIPQDLNAPHATILIVDDEPGICELLEAIVLGLGHKALAARSGKDALRLNRQHMETIHLVMLDVKLPDVSALDLSAILRFHHPFVPILYMSGYSKDHFPNLGESSGPIAFLEKPFMPIDVEIKIKHMLAACRRQN